MKTIGRILVGVVLTFNSALVSAELTAFEPTTLWPDNNGVHINAHGGGVLFHEGSYYWFGEHKTQGRRGNTAQVGVHCYASTDLYNWDDKGIALAVSEDPQSEIVRGCVIERPKVIYNPKTKKFVMWFHLELKGQGYTAARTAVAVSDTATGPYAYLRSFRPNAGKLPLNVTDEDQQPSKENYFQRDIKPGQMARDMTLYVDDDGKAYHIAAAEENYTLHVSLLTDDFLDFTGKFSRVLIRMHREAPAVCKRNGIYYLLSSGCTGWAPNPASYAVADNIFGPYKPMHNPCLGVNPHNQMGPELTFGGQSTYILPVEGKKDAFIAMFDAWQPQNPIDGRYIWLPIEFKDEIMVIQYREKWDLAVFDYQ
jgi:hypothetical protein